MAKKAVKSTKVMMTNTQFKDMTTIVSNQVMTMHRELLNRLTNAQTDIDNACNYPVSLTIDDYKTFYDRMGLAKRAVQIWPDECWHSAPKIFEEESPEETPFEKAWKELEVKRALFSYLHKVDVLSGIGEFGVLLLGFDDGLTLDKPVAGVDQTTGEIDEKTRKETKLLYIRAYHQGVLTISKTEPNIMSPRYGMPTYYTIQYKDTGTTNLTSSRVHWTRVLHVADNRECSEILGVSRLQPIYNNLCDIKKVSGGSGEMFWKGGFPGYSFELTPEAQAMGAEIDADSVKEQMVAYSTGLQRWLSLTGVTAKSLNPQVSDPTGHVDIHFKLVAVSLGVPYRVLLGSEEAKLASVQDKRTWNNRVARRQNNYLSPMVLRPFVDRLIAVGCLPIPKQYTAVWPDLNAATDDDISKIALTRTTAFAQYIAGGVDNLVPPLQYFTKIHKMSDAEAQAIETERTKYESELRPEEPKDEGGNEDKDKDKSKDKKKEK